MTTSRSPNRLIRLHGYPIAYSLAPLFQNTCFEADSYPCKYELYSTSKVTQDVLDFLARDECLGAAFTMPLKAQIIPHLHDITPESRLTGAVNTVVKVRLEGGVKLIGTNTDFLGILSTLRTAIYQQHVGSTNSFSGSACRFAPGHYSAVVVGGGATTRSAILALWTLGIQHICLVGRDDNEIQDTITWFKRAGLQEEGLDLRRIASLDEAEELHGQEASGWPALALGVGAIPSILPATRQERNVYSTTAHLLTLSRTDSQTPSAPLSRHDDDHIQQLPPIQRPIFLDMAYHPRDTHLLKLADALGWQTISGEVAMIEQGLAQQRMWRLGDPSADAGTREGVVSAEATRAAREAIEGMGRMHVEREEVDLAVRWNL